MFNHTAIQSRLLIAVALFGVQQAAFAYTIDGQVSDWGVTATGHASDWTPNSGVQYAVSDQVNNTLSGGYVVNYTAPGSLGDGGQEYDAEAIYLDFDSTYLYYAVVTGRPENVSQYPAGDIAFDFGSDGSYEFGVETRGNNGYSQGDLVQVSAWALGNPYAQAGVSEMLSGGTVIASNGSSDFVYGSKIEDIGQYTYPTYGANDDNHYVLEGRIALADFGLYAGQEFTIHWTMGCGNDEIHLVATLPGTPPGPDGDVPIPGTGLLMGGALLGWVGYRRRTDRAAKATDSDDA